LHNPSLSPPAGISQWAYCYLVERRDSGSALTVIKGEQAFSEPILWAFGQGLDKAKQGRLTSSNTKARIMRAELAFYNETQSLDLTIGHARSAPGILRAQPPWTAAA
jgi:hypothetical protein